MTDDEHPLLDRLRWVSEWYFVDPVNGAAYASDDPLDAADRIEELEARYEKSQDQIERLIAENERLRNAGDGDVGLIHWQGERIEQLEAALRDVFEQWAGSEGFIAETAPEGYLLQLTKRMADIARAPLGDAK